MLDRYKLAFSFSPELLKADLGQISPNEWLAHFNKGAYDGDWSGVVLRGQAENTETLFTGSGSASAFHDAEVLQRCGYFREVLAAFRCEIKSARLLRLTSGSVIKEHRDYDLGYEAGEVRLHLPVLTNPAVEFYLNNRRVTLAEGEVWYLDLSCPHRVANRSSEPRIHLVLDLILNDWLRAQIPFDTAMVAEPNAIQLDTQTATHNLQCFRQRVREDVALQEQLREMLDRQLFIDEVVRLGRETGLEFLPEHVHEALQEERRAWNQRSIA
jgi:hypothetical protein